MCKNVQHNRNAIVQNYLSYSPVLKFGFICVAPLEGTPCKVCGIFLRPGTLYVEEAKPVRACR
jgi:hypothetical protein